MIPYEGDLRGYRHVQGESGEVDNYEINAQVQVVCGECSSRSLENELNC